MITSVHEWINSIGRHSVYLLWSVTLQTTRTQQLFNWERVLYTYYVSCKENVTRLMYLFLNLTFQLNSKTSHFWNMYIGTSLMFIGPCIFVISEEHKNQIDTTWYFIVLLIGSTCFEHYYTHHQELATMMLFTTLVLSFLVCCRLEVRCSLAGVMSGLQAQAQLVFSRLDQLCFSLQPGNYSSLNAPNLQLTANQERNDQMW